MRSEQTCPADVLSGEDVADMHLYAGWPYPGQTVRQGKAGMAVGPRIEDDARSIFMMRPFKTIQQHAFMVGLEKIQPYLREARTEQIFDHARHGIHAACAVYFRLAGAESAQIGPVDNQNRKLRHGRLICSPRLARACRLYGNALRLATDFSPLSPRESTVFHEFFMPPRLVLEHTVYTPDQIPVSSLPQVALAGRSNVGKSSLINALAGHKGLAKVSSSPGKTRSLNFYRAPAENFFLVDLPGYGYARCSKAEQAAYTRLIEEYLTKTVELNALILLLDCRLEPQKSDIALAAFASERNIALVSVLTKADKCTQREREKRRRHWAVLLDTPPLLCSAVKACGLEELWAELRAAACRRRGLCRQPL